MSLESFFGLDTAESGSSSPEAAEKFREQMREAAAASRAIAGNQAQQLQFEEKLVMLLKRILQDDQSQALTHLIVRLLRENVPGPFIVSALTLYDASLRDDIHKLLVQELKLLEAMQEPGLMEAPQKTLALSGDEILSADQKENLQDWTMVVLEAAKILPGKTFKNLMTSDQKLKAIVLELFMYSLERYFEDQKITLDTALVKQYALLCIQFVLIELKKITHTQSDAEWVERGYQDFLTS